MTAEDVDEEAPCTNLKGTRKKNTRKWCKGVEGRKHEFEVVEKTWGYSFRSTYPQTRAHFVDKCRKCGKEANDFYVWLWKPQWKRDLDARRGQ